MDVEKKARQKARALGIDAIGMALAVLAGGEAHDLIEDLQRGAGAEGGSGGADAADVESGGVGGVGAGAAKAVGAAKRAVSASEMPRLVRLVHGSTASMPKMVSTFLEQTPQDVAPASKVQIKATISSIAACVATHPEPTMRPSHGAT